MSGSAPPPRAVAVVLHAGQVLIMRRERAGRRYAVLPGGGVEAGETVEQATLRELQEETGIVGRVVRPLWTLHAAGRRMDHLLVSVRPGPMRMSGPETAAMSDGNRYQPVFVPLAALDDEHLQPTELRDLLRALRP